MGAQDPVASGLVASLARPGGNIRALAMFGPELAAKRLALIKETVPSLRRVGVLRNPANPRQMAPQIEETERAAQSLGVQLQIVDWDGSDGAFRAMVRQGAEAVIVLGDALLFDHRRRIVELARTHQIPSFHEAREYVEAGGLASYGWTILWVSERYAIIVDGEVLDLLEKGSGMHSCSEPNTRDAGWRRRQEEHPRWERGYLRPSRHTSGWKRC